MDLVDPKRPWVEDPVHGECSEWDGYEYHKVQSVYQARRDIVGKLACCRYWPCNQNPEVYRFAFSRAVDVEFDGHAYTIVCENGTRERLISYDDVCVIVEG